MTRRRGAGTPVLWVLGAIAAVTAAALLGYITSGIVPWSP
jgi:hypothetical protein